MTDAVKNDPIVVTPSETAPAQKPLQPSTMPANTPMELLSMAVSQNAPMDKLEKLMELQQRWEENEARKAYNKATAKFKKNPPKVIKDMVNKQYGSRYSSLANFVNTVNEALSKYDLHAHWEFDQTNGIKVTCVLSHTLGHSDSVSLSGPPDTSGAKNTLQQIKSTITYLKLATFEGITGIASVEGNLDDDANASEPYETITEQQVADIKCMIDEIGTDEVKFLRHLKISALGELRASSYSEAVRLLENDRRRRGKLPPYPVDQFEKNLPAWHKAIAEGKRTADQIISMVSTKGALTDAQKARIKTTPKTDAAPKDEFIEEYERAENAQEKKQ